MAGLARAPSARASAGPYDAPPGRAQAAGAPRAERSRHAGRLRHPSHRRWTVDGGWRLAVGGWRLAVGSRQ
ncbi:hypothetical protein D8O05_18880 [Burkholderia mallei]|nr:hypothetical protein D8O05_18880 [Burkholderia mallei]RPA52510.1 hypothetical protein EGT66_06580 [Burkholderia mallei]